MSDRVHERFKNYVLPKKPSEMTLKATVEKLNKLFGKVDTEVSQRYKCLQLAKGDNEDFREYASKVNLQCELFKLGEMKIDQFKCVIFVLGLKSGKDNNIRIRLLKLLDDSKDSMNLDQLVDETQIILDLKTDNTMIEHQTKSVCAIGKSMKKPQPTTKVPKLPCWLCGDLHYVKFCPFNKHKCSNQMGHKGNYCASSKNGYTPKTNYTDNNNGNIKTKTPKKFNTSKSSYRTNAVYSTKRLQFQELRKYIELGINNQPVRLQIDTASDISIISTTTWETIGKPEAFTTNDSANEVNTNKINLLAKFNCFVSHGDATMDLQCYITDIEELNIMGINWIESFKLWDQPISAWCRQIKF
ncbi:uncharacterized protein K02A2.6-like [Lucilia sericata]|uniref:uncharacterized protein K02A2.6-like n=1 Tax=Lucilia sericata TaxID=13632 RepID=UPI0018A83F68|nr:uncharacterized protein K02A2.6-like [Lucilia sericata]